MRSRHVEKVDLSKIASVAGKNVEIKYVDGRIGAIWEGRPQSEKNKGGVGNNSRIM
jgi:hypothetical protein